ncbi:unnamed protein product [Pleuronectes platessa]|uniref:Uncharacterized protein n=1 Tax=Pleuronectes platessa TaxID=8262 RepID=A0A9N7YES3_PLEPL|nr:unnamed protein product [Pleuronectes platessa]
MAYQAAWRNSTVSKRNLVKSRCYLLQVEAALGACWSDKAKRMEDGSGRDMTLMGGSRSGGSRSLHRCPWSKLRAHGSLNFTHTRDSFPQLEAGGRPPVGRETKSPSWTHHCRHITAWPTPNER